MTRTGLTLGKFAPLHIGHQYLIEKALSRTDHLIVMIYDCPETTDIPLPVRAAWIRDLYPSVEVIEAWNGPTEVGDSPALKRRHEEYILRTLAGRKVTHFFSSEFYGDHVSRALAAGNCLVDEARSRYPISASEVRKDPYEYRRFISPRVYRDLITNVVFVGAPSTGKSTIAETMAAKFATVFMPEYGREYWDKHQVGRRLNLEQLVEIAEGHLEREDRAICEANKYLFTDTNAITTYMFSLYYHGKAHPRLVELARQAEGRYDLTFLCDTDIPYDDTWDRSGAVNRKTFQQRIIEDLTRRSVPYVTLCGNLEDRTRRVSEVLVQHRKYSG